MERGRPSAPIAGRAGEVSRLTVPGDVAARLAELPRATGFPRGPRTRLAALLDLVAAEPAAITTVRDPAEGVDVARGRLARGPRPAGRARRPPDRRSRLWRRVSGPRAGHRAARGARGAGRERRAQVRLPAPAAATRSGSPTSRWSTPARRRGRRASARTTSSWPRALAPLPVLVEYAAPLLAPGGALVAWKGRREPAEEADGAAAAEALGMSAPEAIARRALRAGPRSAPLPQLEGEPYAGRLPAATGNGPQTADPSLELKVMALRRRTNEARAPTGAAASLTADGDDLRDRESEGRGRQDDDRGQRRRLHRRGRLRDAARRHRPAGQRDGRARAAPRTASRASTTSSAARRPAEEALSTTAIDNLALLPSHPDLAARQRRAPARAGLRDSACARRWRRCATASPTRCWTARRRSAR